MFQLYVQSHVCYHECTEFGSFKWKRALEQVVYQNAHPVSSSATKTTCSQIQTEEAPEHYGLALSLDDV